MPATPAPVRTYPERPSQSPRARSEAFRDLQRLLAREYRSDPALLEKLVRHADEQLPWLLVAQEPDLAYPDRVEDEQWREQLPALRAALCLRAHEDLSREGICWSPLLDALVSSEVWETEGDLPGSNLSTPSELLKPLGEWVAEESTPAGLRELLSFRCDRVADLVARNAPDLSPELALQLAERPTVLYTLSERENLPRPTLRALAERAWAEYQRETELATRMRLEYGSDQRTAWARLLGSMTQAMGECPPEMRAPLLEEIQAPVQEGWRAVRTAQRRDLLIRALAAEPSLSRTEYLTLANLYSGEYDTPLSLLRNPASTAEDWRGLLERLERPAVECWRWVVEHDSELPLPLLERAVREHPGTYDLVCQVALHPQATPALRVQVATGPRAHRVQLALCERPDLRREPLLRATLRETPWPAVLVALLEDADAEEWVQLFRRLAPLDPALASRALETASPLQSSRLSRADFAPLLASERADIRLSVIRQLAAREEPLPAPSPDLRR